MSCSKYTAFVDPSCFCCRLASGTAGDFTTIMDLCETWRAFVDQITWNLWSFTSVSFLAVADLAMLFLLLTVWEAIQNPWQIHGTGIFITTWMVDFYGKVVGKYIKYTSHMDPVGNARWCLAKFRDPKWNLGNKLWKFKSTIRIAPRLCKEFLYGSSKSILNAWSWASSQTFCNMITTRWFKVTFSSPSWRSLSLSKRSLNHPKNGTSRIARYIIFINKLPSVSVISCDPSPQFFFWRHFFWTTTTTTTTPPPSLSRWICWENISGRLRVLLGSRDHRGRRCGA